MIACSKVSIRREESQLQELLSWGEGVYRTTFNNYYSNHVLPDVQDCEKIGVTLDYLEKLHKEYLKFLQMMRSV